MDAFCVDKSILAVYKTAGRSYIDAEFSPQEYGIATTKGSGFSKLCEDELVRHLALRRHHRRPDCTVQPGLISNNKSYEAERLSWQLAPNQRAPASLGSSGPFDLGNTIWRRYHGWNLFRKSLE